MRWITGVIIAAAMSAGAAQAGPNDARPAAFSNRLPAESTVEIRSMPGVDVARLRAEDSRRSAKLANAPVRFAAPLAVDITPTSAGDWDQVVKLEGACVLLISQLKQAARELPLGQEETRVKSRIMQRILVNDAEVRHLAEPWLPDLHRLMQGKATPTLH